MRRVIPGATIGLSALLLFLIQPLISKAILPLFGGGATVWLVALVFFQCVLLGGYAAAHFLAARWSRARQAVFLACLAVGCLFLLPIDVRNPGLELRPALGIVVLLFSSLGLPYFLLSMTTPLVQHWLTHSREPRGGNPYILFGISNGGSLAALLLFPLAIEPHLATSQQRMLWSIVFLGYLACLAACLLTLPPSGSWSRTPSPRGCAGSEGLSGRGKLRILYQAMIPSVALLAFTQHITVEIASVPLFWVLPLCAYLLSFVVSFVAPKVNEPSAGRTLALLLPILAMVALSRPELGWGAIPRVAVTLAALFAICLFFHGNLERAKPDHRSLTSFYLYLSAGGCAGGIFVAIVAPLIFRSLVEFQLTLLASVYFMVSGLLERGLRRRAFALVVCAVSTTAYANEEFVRHHAVTGRLRSFYSAYTIREETVQGPTAGQARLLNVGTTLHGGQFRDREKNLVPLFYYYRESGIARALEAFPHASRIAVIGLGTGVVALYGAAGQSIDFYEIDPKVVEIATTAFDNLRESRAEVRNYVGDARLELRKRRDRLYDLIIVDAFSSDAIPTHLLTVEATRELLARLRPDGALVYNISNRFLNLESVLKADADQSGLAGALHDHSGESGSYKLPALWVALARDRGVLARITRGDSRWRSLRPERTCWTDDFSHLWSVLDL